jgi:hypothetical protein
MRSWVCHGALFCFYFLKNRDMIQMIMISTTRIAITPTATPALNMPVITEQLLKANNTVVSSNKFNFFIDRCCFDKYNGDGGMFLVKQLSD